MFWGDKISEIKQIVFLDESNKHWVDEFYYISAVVINTRRSISFFDLFSDLVNRHKNSMKPAPKELKFKKMHKSNAIRFTQDLNRYHVSFSIHINRGSRNNPPIDTVNQILDHIDSSIPVQRTLIVDENLITDTDISSLSARFSIKKAKSHKVPGLQIADIVAGSYRRYDEGHQEFLNNIVNHLCNHSRQIL